MRSASGACMRRTACRNTGAARRARSGSCTVCGQALQSATSQCGNALCRTRDRAFVFNRATAMKTRVLDTAINRHKYHGKLGWWIIFARVRDDQDGHNH